MLRLMPRRRLPRAEREEQMGDAALELFTERGFDDAARAAIAARVGITKPMLYSYFGSKEGLYLACIERAARPMIETMQAAALAESEPDRRLWSGTRAFLGWVEEHREVWARFYVQ